MTMRSIKNILLFLLKKYQQIKGNFRIYRDCRLLIKYKPSIRRFPLQKYTDSDKILLLVPHADDELINSHIFIKNYKSQIILFYCSFTGSNNDHNNRIIREKEFVEYCRNMDVSYYIADPKIDLLSQLKDLVFKYKPNVMSLTSIIDWHPEHRLLSYLLLDLLKSNNTITKVDIYSVSFPMPPQFINSVYCMTREEHVGKWNVFNKIYKSQKSLNTYRFKCWERFYASYFKNMYAIEFHHIFTSEEWQSWVLRKMQMSVPQSIVNDMRAVLALSTELYVK